MLKRSILILFVIALLMPVISLAEYTIWHSPLTLSTNNSSLIIEPYYGPGSAITITATNPGDLQWVHLGLTLPSNVEIRGVTLCYQLSPGSSSYISQIRVSSMTLPDAAWVLWDDPDDLTDPGPTCVTSVMTPIPVEGTMTIALRLNVAAAGDWFLIGGVGIIVEQVSTSAPANFGILSPRLQQSTPNPFIKNTKLSFTLSSSSRQVEMQIMDVNGRRIRTIALSGLPAGRHEIVWDGQNDSGTRVAAGAYFSRLIADGQVIGTGDMVRLN